MQMAEGDFRKFEVQFSETKMDFTFSKLALPTYTRGPITELSRHATLYQDC